MRVWSDGEARTTGNPGGVAQSALAKALDVRARERWSASGGFGSLAASPAIMARRARREAELTPALLSALRAAGSAGMTRGAMSRALHAAPDAFSAALRGLCDAGLVKPCRRTRVGRSGGWGLVFVASDTEGSK